MHGELRSCVQGVQLLQVIRCALAEVGKDSRFPQTWWKSSLRTLKSNDFFPWSVRLGGISNLLLVAHLVSCWSSWADDIRKM